MSTYHFVAASESFLPAGVHDLLDTEIAVVEVLWNGRIEAVSFPRPRDCAYLPSKTMKEFLITADLSTSEKRMKQLLAKAPRTFPAFAQGIIQ